MYQTAGTVTIRAEGKAKERQVSWLGQCFQGNICQSNTKTNRSTGRWVVGKKAAWVRGEHGEMGDSNGDGGENHRVLAVKTDLLYKCL